MSETRPRKGAGGPQPEAQQQRKQSGRRKPVQYESESDYSEAENEPLRRRRASQKAGSQNLVPVGGALDSVTNTATGLTDTVGQTLQGATGSALNKGGDKQKDTLKLRLDLNLDVEITLKARIHGDLELALLN